MLSRFIDFRYFIVSLAIGIFLVYINQPAPTIIYVYPTPKILNYLKNRKIKNYIMAYTQCKPQ